MVFVTGGTGLVGSHLLYQLAKNGERVVALVRDVNRVKLVKKVFSYYSSNDNLMDNIEFVEGNILNVALLNSIMQRVDFVYHCAAMVSFQSYDANEMTEINVQGTANIVNSGLHNNIKKMCYVSSTAAIGKNKNEGFNTEETEWIQEGASNYSVSKYLAEQEVWRGINNGLNSVIVNPSIILGPGDWGKSSTNLFDEVWKGLFFYTTGSNAFVDVRDVADCMIQLMKSEIVNERFLTVSENVSFQEFFTAIALALNKKPPYIKASSLVTDIGWKVEKLKSYITKKAPRLTKEYARSGQSNQLFSNQKIKNAIGKEFISVKKSIEETAKLYLKDQSI